MPKTVQGQSGRSTRRTPYAFSLIEVLVVTGIVALLIAVLMPSLARARAKGREVACAAHLRNWGQAFHLYAHSHNGFLPHTDDRARNRPPDVYDPAYPEHEFCYIDVLPPLLQRPAWRSFPEGAKQTGDIWQCGEARPLPDSAYSPQYRPSRQGYHSYAMNSYLTYDFPFGREEGIEPYPAFLQLSRCKAPSRTILMFEQTLDPARGYGLQGGHDMAGRYTAEDARALSERHARTSGQLGGNVLMIDGHIEWRSDLWDERLPNPRLPRRGDLNWFPY
ncbi:MAG: type II secretion system protein [Phycisphaerales bacterium]|nr:type II secretion system protein [Phycisphaerales bacterium]